MNRVIILSTVVVIFAIFTSSFFIFSFYIRHDTTPPAWDEASHLSIVLDKSKMIKSGISGIDKAITYYQDYPPLVHLLFLAFTWGLGISKQSVLLFNFLLLALCLLVVFYYERKSSNVATASLSVTLLLTVILTSSFSPNTMLWGVNTWEFMLDLPLSLVLIVTLLLFEKIIKGQSSSMKHSFFFAVALSATLLVKQAGIIFLLFPFVYYFIVLIFSIPKNLKAFLIFVVTITLLNRWYLVNFQKIIDGLFHHAIYVGLAIEKDPQGLQGILTIILAIARSLRELSLLIIAGFIVFLTRYFKIFLRRPSIKLEAFTTFLTQNIFLLNILASFIFLSAIPNKEDRYVFPLVLLIVIFASRELGKLSKFAQPLFIGCVAVTYGVRVMFFMPAPSSAIYAYQYVKQLISERKEPIHYFFEDDGPFFNYANVAYLHKTFDTDFELLNLNYAMSPYMARCEITYYEPRFIVVYSRKQKLQNDTTDIKFETACKKLASSCQLIKTISFKYELLKLFSCTGNLKYNHL